MRAVLALLAALAVLSGAAAPAPRASASVASGRHTVRTVVRPVGRDGVPAAGWRVVRERIYGFTCNSGPSRVAVDPGIRYCGAAITNTVACWKSARHTVLCMRNPRVHQLVRIRYRGAFRPVRAAARPSPQALDLVSGNRCIIRSGGAWSPVKRHPRWFGTYSCARGNLYGPGRDGIDRSVRPWRVHLVLNPRRPTIRQRRVAIAYYAGNAR
ncbi:MAG TPA: hypothetical protein VFH38_07250 [Jatrophihabitans sp.]|nr:hypothetical protein [Jatrophihabitans sp.]